MLTRTGQAPPRFDVLAQVAGIYASFVGLLALAGWLFDIAPLRGGMSNTSPIQVSAASLHDAFERSGRNARAA